MGLFNHRTINYHRTIHMDVGLKLKKKPPHGNFPLVLIHVAYYCKKNISTGYVEMPPNISVLFKVD